MSLIEARDLTHRFADGTQALGGVNLIVERGEFVLIVGRNGSGKTVLVRHFNGLLLPTRGTVHVAGVPVPKNPAAARRRVGMIFQDADSQIVAETAFEEVAFGLRNLGMDEGEVTERARDALRRLGLQDSQDRDPHRLSGGEKRRLAIAAVLVTDPEIIVFDEPLATLDYPGVAEVLRAILDLHRRGHTVLVVTHDVARIGAHATRLVVMDRGIVVVDGTLETALPQLERYGVRRPAPGDPLSWLS